MPKIRSDSAIFISFMALLLFLLLLPIQPPPKAYAQTPDVEYWAVIVGVADYPGTANDLEYADDDATELYNQLAPIWGADHIRLLLDSQATKADIQNAISGWLDPQEDANDVVLFFFAGHGDWCPDYYICPYSGGYISDNDLDSWLDKLESGKVVVILDSCHSGGFIGELSQPGRVIMTACYSFQSAYEDPSLEHAVFSYYIIEAFSHLDAVNANGDDTISAEEIFNYAKSKVFSYVGWQQSPRLGDSYSGELVLFYIATFDTMPRVAPLIIDGTTYSDEDLPVSLIWIPGLLYDCDIQSSVSGGIGIQYLFTLWSDGNTSPSITVSQPGAYTANYQTQYYLTVESDYGDPQGEGWYDSGSTATISVTPSTGTPIRQIFTGWSGDSTATTTTATVVMDGPKTVTANWRNYLTVESDYGDPQGEGWYDSGSTATISVTSPTGMLIRHVFTGWSGDSTATTATATILMDGPKTLIANWRTDYTYLYILIGGIAGAAGAAVVIVMILRRRRRKALEEGKLD